MSNKPPKDRMEQHRLAYEARQYLTPDEQAEMDRLLWSVPRERERYRHNPPAFAREVLHMDLAPYQEEVLWKLHDKKRVAFRGPRGTGKSTIGAAAVLWFLSVFDECKVPTTAGSWRQLTAFLWPEIHKWALKADWWRVGFIVRPGKELLSQSLEINQDKNHAAFAIASSDEARIEGAHSVAVLMLFDEAKTITDSIWDSAEGGLGTGKEAYALALSTPGDNVGRFFDIFKKREKYKHWETVAATLEQAIASGRIEREWAEKMAIQWGTDSVMYKRHVLGNFAEDTGDTLISLGWIERAQERWYDRQRKVEELIESGIHRDTADELVWGALSCIGVDPARYGADKTGWAFRYGSAIRSVARTDKEDTMETADRTQEYMQGNTAVAKIDVNGLGAGVFDRLRQMWKRRELRTPHDKVLPLVPINSKNATKARDKSGELGFRSMRDYLWWNLREMLEDENGDIALPPETDEENTLVQDLLSPKWSPNSGKIEIESKDDIKKRLGRSPDVGDAVVQAFAPDTAPYTPKVAFL